MSNKKFRNEDSKKKNILIICIGIVLALIACIGCYWVMQSKFTNKPTDNIKDTEDVTLSGMPANSIKLYQLKSDMSAGDLLHFDSFTEVQIDPTTIEVASDVITNSDMLIDKRIKKDVKQNEYLRESDLIHKNAWYEDGDRRIEHVFVDGAIPITIQRTEIVGKYVDIMLFVKGSEDLVVVSKEPIIAQDGNTLAFNLNHEQIESLKEAATEGTFYIRVYLSETQEPSIITYKPQ